jgi:branched-chain amino acid aminotransferase
MPSGLACVDGVLTPAEEARIPVTDEGLVRGDGAFEVIRLYGGIPFALDRHLTRLAGSAEGLRLGLDIAAVREDIELILGECAEDDELVRVMVTRGGRRITLLETLPPVAESCSLGQVTYSPPRLLDGIKSLSYAANMLATRLARERGFDEALLVTPHERVLECPTASFFAVRDGAVLTPPLSEHILDSITRALVIEVAGASEEPLTATDLETIDEAFLASSVVEVLPVRRIEAWDLAAPGERTTAVASAVREQIIALTSG